MTTTEIKTAVINLNKTELRELLNWLKEYQESLWNKQIEDDRQSGKLDALIEKAKKKLAMVQSDYWNCIKPLCSKRYNDFCSESLKSLQGQTFRLFNN
ncbi:MAG: hypothetical protein VKL42_06790 [Snowella sp.]|nr:hypothetical protein [Snowella sp.]